MFEDSKTILQACSGQVSGLVCLGGAGAPPPARRSFQRYGPSDRGLDGPADG